MHLRVLAMTALLLCSNAAAASERSLSEEFGVCLNGFESAEITRSVVIDVEKTDVTVGGRKLAEFVFDELGLGAYNRLIKDGSVRGVSFDANGEVTVYAKLFQGQSLVFIAKASNPLPVWIYATFPDIHHAVDVDQATRVMMALRACNPS